MLISLTWIKRKICRVFNVPAELIGDSENKTYSNYQEARLALYMETALPIAFWLRDELNNWLVRKYDAQPKEGEFSVAPTMELDWDLDKVAALAAEKAKAYDRMAGAWWTTLNEKRVACGYDEKPGGDIAFIPMGLTSLDLEEEPGDDLPPNTEPAKPDTLPEEDETPPKDEPGKSRLHLKGYWNIPERKKALWLTFEQRIKAREKVFESIAKGYLKDEASEIQGKLQKLSSLDAVAT
jgi:hypothetical protein